MIIIKIKENDKGWIAWFEDSKGYKTHLHGHKKFSTLKVSIKENMDIRKESYQLNYQPRYLKIKKE